MRTAVVERPLDPAALLAEVAQSGNGAALIFVGTVREVNEGRAVTGIDYSAYRPMAASELAAVAAEASARFGVADLVVEHRLGSLALGEASVVIAAAHPHRAPAFDAARYVIEELKRRVPIWKREHYVDGTREWVGQSGRASDDPRPERPGRGTRDAGLAEPDARSVDRGGPPPTSESTGAPADDRHRSIAGRTASRAAGARPQ